MAILITGVAGFIGSHLASRLLRDGYDLIGIDNLNSYYDVDLKAARLARLQDNSNFEFLKLDLSRSDELDQVSGAHQIDAVVHLAAQAGVRYSIGHPEEYIASNIVGFANLIEWCVGRQIGKFMYASSSSVYGDSQNTPYEVGQCVDRPVSLYAATKAANELIAHAYSSIHGLTTIGLRFFTVYGPWGRPDMSYFKFADLIRENKTIDVYGNGDMRRDFTYIDDVVESVCRLMEAYGMYTGRRRGGGREVGDRKHSLPMSEVYNIGSSRPIRLMDFIKTLERSMGIVAKKEMLPMQPGDVKQTFADTQPLEAVTGYKPDTPFVKGISEFARWHSSYRNSHLS